jgi:hypothetical protein
MALHMYFLKMYIASQNAIKILKKDFFSILFLKKYTR